MVNIWFLIRIIISSTSRLPKKNVELTLNNSRPHPTSGGAVFFLLFILRYHGNCVSLHPDNTKRKEIIMLREPIIIENPSAGTLKIIEILKENKRNLIKQMHEQRDLAIDITKG